MSTPRIVTWRLALTPLVAEDAPAFFAYRSDPGVCAYQGFEPGTLEDARRFIDAMQKTPFGRPGSWFQLGIRLREAGQLVGDVGIHFLAEDDRQAEIGFTVASRHQRRGYGSEAVTGVLAYLFGPGRHHRVIASVDPRNAPSVALLRRVGMRQEAHFVKSLWFKGAWADDLVFAVLASEWRERHPEDVSPGNGS